MNAISLFDDLEPIPVRSRHPYAAGSDTSKAAARQARWFSGGQCDRLYAFLVRCGDFGATDKEIARVLDMGRPTICARRKGLAGRIKDSGIRREGCAAWVIS